MYERAVELDRDKDPGAAGGGLLASLVAAQTPNEERVHQAGQRLVTPRSAAATKTWPGQLWREPALRPASAATMHSRSRYRKPLSAWRSSRRPLRSSIAPSETLPKPTRGHTTPTTLSFRLGRGLVRVQLVALISAELSTRSKTTRVEKRCAGRRAMPSPAALRTPSGLRLGTP